MITNCCIELYRYFRTHRAVYAILLLCLFGVFGYFSTQIHLEEDINKLMPSSKNPDGTTKLAFADLRIKDKTYLLFEGTNTDSIIAVCDAFIDSLSARDPKHEMVENVFYRLPDELMPDAIEYLSAHLPSFIDTACYASIDTMLTVEHFRRQMAQNHDDLTGDFGSAYPELIEMDPIGLRGLLLQSLMPATSDTVAKKGGYTLIDDHLFVSDSTVCLAFITPAFSATNTGQGSALFENLNELIASHKGNVKICYHGTPASGFYNASTIKNDLIWTVSGSLLIVLIFILFCFRRWEVLPLMVLPVVFGTLFSLTLMYMIKGELSLLALGIGGVVLGVALSYALHILVHHAYVEDVATVLRDETKPVILGCITTIGSFVGIMFVHTDLLRDFGLFAAFAITGTMFFCLALLPAMLPAKAKGIPASIDKISTYPADRNKAALAVIGLLTLATLGAFCIGGVNFDANMHNLGYDSENVLHSEKLLESKTYTGDKEKYFASSGKTMEEAITNFGVLAEKLDSLQSIGLVKGYSHTNDILVPISVQQERIDAWKRYWTKERLAKVQQLINATAPAAGLVSDGFEAFFELAEADFQPDTLYKAGLIPDGYLSTLMERSYGGDYLCFTNVRCKEEAQDADSTDYNRICQAIATQPNMMVLDTYFYTRDTLKQLNEDFNALQWVSLLFVLIVLFVSFGFNIKHSLLGFMPILLSWIIVLGAMFIFGKGFNLINIVISTFIFGIGVDYSIFVMNGLVSPEGNKLQYHRTAILLSAVILIVSVGSMVIAKHPAIQSVGFSTLVGLVSAVVLAWVVQPAIYRLTNRKK